MKKPLIMIALFLSGLSSRANGLCPIPDPELNITITSSQCLFNLTVMNNVWQECGNYTNYTLDDAKRSECACVCTGCRPDNMGNSTGQWVPCDISAVSVAVMVMIAFEATLAWSGILYPIIKNELENTKVFIKVSTSLIICLTGIVGFATTVATYKKHYSALYATASMVGTAVTCLLTRVGFYACKELKSAHQSRRVEPAVQLSVPRNRQTTAQQYTPLR